MSLRIWNPFVELARLEKDIREAFEPFSGTNSDSFFAPLTDISENNDGFEIHMNIPGIKPENLKIDATSDYLELTAESETETKLEDNESTEKSEYTPRHIERVSRKYYRKIHFTAPVDPSKAKTSLKDGVLLINIPKRPEAKKVSLRIE
jgi:HSP20 family protein